MSNLQPAVSLIYPRHPGCNVWMSTGGGGGWRCGDMDGALVVHLCASCAAQVAPEDAGERDALIAEWVSMLDPEGWTQEDRAEVAAGLRSDLPPIAGLRALVDRHRRWRANR
jgi:hypothetical protein